MKIYLRVFCLALLLVVLPISSGCASRRGSVTDTQADFLISPILLEANFYAGDVLSKMLDKRLPAQAGILVVNLVDLDNLDNTSALGRLSTQQIASRLTQQNFRVIEVRLGAELLIEEHDGEFMLTRDVSQLLGNEHNASAVLLGTYSDAGEGLFFSVRVVGLERNTILAAHEYFLPLSGEVEHLYFTKWQGQHRENFSQSVQQVWEKHAVRQQVFTRPAAVSPTVAKKQAPMPKPQPVTSPAPTVSAPIPPVQVPKPLPPAYTRPEQSLPEGRPIDPNAPPTPFPGKKK